MRTLTFALLLFASPVAAQGTGRITEADVRTFVSRQEKAWNAGDLDGYFGSFTSGARFTDQAYVGADKAPFPYGTSTLAQARRQAAKSRAKSVERGEVRGVEIAADGRSARVTIRVGSTLTSGAAIRRLCAARVQTLVLDTGRLRSSGRTDTFVKCAR